MKKRFLLMLTMLIVALFVFGGCGGGGGGGGDKPDPDKLLKGYFIDAPVEGLRYVRSSGESGTTNAAGEFEYKAGDEVEFFVGDIYLRSIPAALEITPNSYFAGSTKDDPKVIQLVRFILSASDYTSSSVSIRDNPYSGYSEVYSDTLFASLEAAELIYVTADQAKKHYNPGNDPEPSEIDGTWTLESVSVFSAIPPNKLDHSMISGSALPSQFEVKMVAYDDYYLLVINDNNDVTLRWHYESPAYEDRNGSLNFTNDPPIEFQKVGPGEKYVADYSDDDIVFTCELVSSSELVFTVKMTYPFNNKAVFRRVE